MGANLEPLLMVPSTHLPPTIAVRASPSGSTLRFGVTHVLVQRRRFALYYQRSYNGGYHLEGMWS